MTAPDDVFDESARLADQVAEVLLAHGSVLRLDGGEYGVIASHLPHRRVTGVRIGARGEPVEVGVVLRLDRPLPEIVAELRDRVKVVAGPVPVDITVSDVVPNDQPEHDTATNGA